MSENPLHRRCRGVEVSLIGVTWSEFRLRIRGKLNSVFVSCGGGFSSWPLPRLLRRSSTSAQFDVAYVTSMRRSGLHPTPSSQAPTQRQGMWPICCKTGWVGQGHLPFNTGWSLAPPSVLPLQAPAALGLTIAAVPPAPALKGLIVHFFETFLERRVPMLVFILDGSWQVCVVCSSLENRYGPTLGKR